MNQSRYMLLIISIALCVNLSIQWSGNGHMIVSQIAKNELQQKNPTLFKQLETIVEYINDQTNGKSQDFVQAATWADDIKSETHKWNLWHYLNTIYNPTNYENDIKPDIDNNITWALPLLSNLLNSGNLDNQNKSESLRLVIHFVGDIHQPLHCAEMVSEKYPKGDEGGNDIKIKGDDLPSYANLHYYWDRIAFAVKYWDRPLSASDYTDLETVCSDITNTYTRDFFKEKLQETDVKIWASESFQFAEKNAYEPLRADLTVDDTYKNQALPIMKQQLAIAGYRLADLLQEIYQNEIQLLENKFLQQ